MTRMLVPILEQVRNLIAPRRSATIVFDRGGWSPKLFQKLLAMDFDILTARAVCDGLPKKDSSGGRPSWMAVR